ncbi:solute carrier family 23 protein [Weissella halotolerans]
MKRMKIKRDAITPLDSLKTEVLAGLTSFFAISYIMIINPMILTDAGIPANLSVFATIFASVLGCLLMAIWAQAPIVLTPGMGVNAFFTYTLVVGMRLNWREAIAISIMSSIIYIMIAFTPLSDFLMATIPQTLKNGITAGIGLFLVTLGLEKAGLVQSGGQRALLAAGSVLNPEVALALFSLCLTLWLFLRKTAGSFIIGIVGTSIVAHFLKIGQQTTVTANLGQLGQYSKLLFQGDFSQGLTPKFLLAVFSMTMILVFESMGILEGLLQDDTKFKRAFQVSSLSTLFSGCLGTSPTVAAAESAAGIESGGRTGIVALTAATGFTLSLFLMSLLQYVPQVAIAPVMIITGAIMMEELAKVDFADFTDWFPSFLIMVLIPLTGSISTGLAFGFIAYPLVKVAAGERRDVHAFLYLLAGLFVAQLVVNSIFQ